MAQVGPAVLMHRLLMDGRVTAADVDEVLDQVVMPLMRRDAGPEHLRRRPADRSDQSMVAWGARSATALRNRCQVPNIVVDHTACDGGIHPHRLPLEVEGQRLHGL